MATATEIDTETDSDRLFLALSMTLAERGRMTCAPNPTVGCVIVRHGQVLGKGWHMHTGQGHAEVQAMTDACADGGHIKGATVYVSLEPCAFVGRTPACAQTLIEAGVARVVVATLDPHPKVAGEGLDMLLRAGVAVVNADLPEARTLIQGYTTRIQSGRPFVRLKTASSLDGATALASGESQWITGEAARDDVQYWRARSDAILTGVGTVLHDNPALTLRAERFRHAKAPLRVVLDAQGRIPRDAQLLNDGLPTLVINNGAVAYADPVAVLASDPHHLETVLAHLATLGCNEVLVEAGARVVGSFLQAGLWDEWVCYVAPSVMGSQTQGTADIAIASMQDVVRGQIIEQHRVGTDLRLRLVPDREQ